MSKFGRYPVPEAPSALARLHFHDGRPLHPIDHEPKIAVLDQEDLLAQRIDVSTFIPGAPNGVDELGSCTANTTIEALSNMLPLAQFLHAVAQLGGATPTGYSDTVAAERAAIGFYSRCTHQTGDLSQEWPPTDCGSSGPYIVAELQRLKLIKSDRIAHGADSIASLMQTDGLLWGTPWLNAWMEPDASAFIDGDGSAATLQTQIAGGVAGGHEIYLSAIEKLTVLPTGHVDPFKTVLRLRNHWTGSWGDHGSARVHLSTIVALGNSADVRQLVV